MFEISVVITGGLHGLGAEIVDRLAHDKCQITIIANTSNVDMDQISKRFSRYRQMGSEVRVLPTDITDERSLESSIKKAAGYSKGIIDVCINAALVSFPLSYAETTGEKLDFFYKINAKSTFMLAKAILPYLKESTSPHFLSIAPSINLDPSVLGTRIAYSATQYLRSMLIVGLANSPEWSGIACNALWPLAPFKDGPSLGIYQTHIDVSSRLKSVKLFSEAVHCIIHQPATRFTGEFFYDEEVLEMMGVSLSQFSTPDRSAELLGIRRHEKNNKNKAINYNHEQPSHNSSCASIMDD